MPYQCLKWIDMPKWSAAFLWANFRVASLSSSVASPGRCWNLLPSAGDFFEIHQTASSLLLWPHCDFHYKLYEGKNFDNTPSWRQKEKIGKNGKLRKLEKLDLQHKRFLLPSCWVKLSPRDMCMASLRVNKSSPPPQRQRWQAHAQPMTIYYYYWLSLNYLPDHQYYQFYQYHHHSAYIIIINRWHLWCSRADPFRGEKCSEVQHARLSPKKGQICERCQRDNQKAHLRLKRMMKHDRST